jgi:hypothetical protein
LPALGILVFAFSPDGKILATGNYAGDAQREDEAIHLWDTATWQEVCQLPEHSGGVRSLVFSSQGTTLAGGTSSGTVLLWDLSRLRERLHPRPRELSAAECVEFWNDLACRDAFRAYQAVTMFTADQNNVVRFLKGKVQPAREVEPGHIATLITNLSSDSFSVREAARKELESVVDLVEPALRAALLTAASLEARKRLESLLEGAGFVKSPEALRRVRVLQILERNGSPEARVLVKQLAEGAPAAYETRAAIAILARLTK